MTTFDTFKRALMAQNKLASLWCLALLVMVASRWLLPVESQVSLLPAALLAASSTGQTPKFSQAPLVQLDMSPQYFKSLGDGLLSNFKRTLTRANERLSPKGNTSLKLEPITLSSGLRIDSLRLEGLDNLRVGGLQLKSNSLRLGAQFVWRSLRLTGACSRESPRRRSDSLTPEVGNLLEASYWNVSWSVVMMQMVGKSEVGNESKFTHKQQRIATPIKNCAAGQTGSQEQAQLRQALELSVTKALEARIKALIELSILQESFFDEQPATSLAMPAMQQRGPLSLASAAAALFTSGRSSRSAAPAALHRSKRQTPCQEGEELDEYADQLLRFGMRIVRAMEPVSLPNTTVELPDYNLKIFLYEGKGSRAYKFRRAKPAWVYCLNDTISLGLTLELDDLRVAYKYRVISGTRLLFDGDFEARVAPRLQAQFSQKKQEEDSEEPVQQRVDRVRLFRLGKVFVVIRGLGNLTNSLSLMINSYLNDNQESLQPTFRMAEGDATRMINRFLKTVNVPILSVVARA